MDRVIAYLAGDCVFAVLLAPLSPALTFGLPLHEKTNKTSPKQRLGLNPDWLDKECAFLWMERQVRIKAEI